MHHCRKDYEKKKIGITQPTINECVVYEGNSRKDSKERGGGVFHKIRRSFFCKYGIIITA